MIVSRATFFGLTIFIFACRYVPALRNAIFPDSYWWLVIAYSAISAISMISRRNREWIAAIVAIAAGVIAGAALSNPCSPAGIVIGPVAGFVVYRWIRGGERRECPIAPREQSPGGSDRADNPKESAYKHIEAPEIVDEVS